METAAQYGILATEHSSAEFHKTGQCRASANGVACVNLALVVV
jgi:hypothetical protein